MGAHGTGFGMQTLIGSNVDRVLRQSSCPVLVARPLKPMVAPPDAGAAPLRFMGNARGRSLGRMHYCASSPRRLWVSLSRARNECGACEVWYLLSNRVRRAGQMAQEYARRFGCEQGFRDAKRRLGFIEARVAESGAWLRFLALFAIALLVLAALGTKLLLAGGQRARELLRRVCSRRRGRCELSVVSAILSLLAQDRSLYRHLSGRTKLNLEGRLAYVS